MILIVSQQSPLPMDMTIRNVTLCILMKKKNLLYLLNAISQAKIDRKLQQIKRVILILL
ncbi:hypothetical protein KPC81_02947 [Klebsiella pneumoniae]|nr:hypothetical protein KPNIH2_06977 [Klebsiella pneumoniae subsp. pneumoniae KPNIH2]EJJ44484.1 hypothetical protein KPNIH4_11960 [Klebsiella pneumoniae subsp. pneumoniae KPNIH4]MCB8849070.1 hypothetical protein [Klebsiella pneumoniae]MCB8852868.1 hypothetical protein [Klebsiella pneumoniae]MCB8868696.1 hypothetical protein [Klebsiella pneumoniae]